MKTITAERMREIDRRCIQGLGLPGAVLMNNAGAAVFQEVREGPVGVVCGKGNNGGDGYVVARLALAAGHETQVVLLAEPSEITGDAAIFLGVYRKMGGAVTVAVTPEAARAAVAALASCRVLVDALLGTGAKGSVCEPMRAAIAAWPAVFTVAVDVPSGLNADTGVPDEVCIRADVTVTLHAAKPGFLASRAAPYLGRLVVADIGIPGVCEEDSRWEQRSGEVDSFE
ncbi:MAG: NAD(P)H-hydrate epimerase [Candidatus Hydrogenedentes bacterium]|nr:NAD(P)H-hydrate epimerase [Candidatus Hydrogenedentota bacterium]